MISIGSQKNLLKQNKLRQSVECRSLSSNVANPAQAANLQRQRVFFHDSELGHLYEPE